MKSDRRDAFTVGGRLWGILKGPAPDSEPSRLEAAIEKLTQRVERLSTADACLTGKPGLTAAEAVDYLGLPSRKALYQAVRRGQVPVHRLGPRRMRFNKIELDRVLNPKGTPPEG